MTASKSWISRLEISIWCPIIEDKSLDLPSFFMVAGGGLMSSIISTIHPNPPLSSLAPFRCYGSAKQTSLFCSHLNRNADKGGLWQDLVLHCFAIAIVAFRSCKNRLEISIWSPTKKEKLNVSPSLFAYSTLSIPLIINAVV